MVAKGEVVGGMVAGDVDGKDAGDCEMKPIGDVDRPADVGKLPLRTYGGTGSAVSTRGGRPPPPAASVLSPLTVDALGPRGPPGMPGTGNGNGKGSVGTGGTTRGGPARICVMRALAGSLPASIACWQ